MSKNYEDEILKLNNRICETENILNVLSGFILDNTEDIKTNTEDILRKTKNT